MNSVELVQQQYSGLHQRIDEVMDNITMEQFNWIPPGSANAISVTFIHMLNAEDFHIRTILQGKPRIWETDRWSDDIGLSAPPGQGMNWEEASNKKLDFKKMLNYQESVRAQTKIYLKGLTAEKLAEDVEFYGGKRSVAQVLADLVIHLAGHSGEIAALKGIQGIKGLPF